MLGKSHVKIGILSCMLISTVPAINKFALFNNGFISIPRGINFAGLALAGLGALAVDADSQHSKINQMNVVTGVFNESVSFIETILMTIINMVFTVGIGAFALYNADVLIKEMSKFSKVAPYAEQLVYGGALILIVLGIAGTKLARYIPVLGTLYNIISNVVSGAAALLKRAWMFLVYIGGGLYIIYYNYNHIHDFKLYLIGVLFIAIAIFPHRTFLHSPEGIILFSVCVSYLLGKVGYAYLAAYFIIGYISHIYWADIFTAEGVPLSSLPTIFEIVKIDNVLIKFDVYKRIKDVLNIKLRLPPHMRTGSDRGNFFETVYILILLAIVVLAFDKYGGAIKFI